jgi:hypothetical protein
MNRLKLCALVALSGCAGLDGKSGNDGTDALSTLLVLQKQTSAADCNGGPGTVVSSYQDTDDSGTVTTGDRLLSQAVVCDGATGATGATGDAGAQGPQGVPGADGQPGVSCTVESVAADPSGPAPNGGALITCGSTSTLVLNGAPGEPGPQGEPGTPAPPTAYSVVALIDPCGDADGYYDEVFLRLANGVVLASFSDNASGDNTRLSVLIDGSFVTSDGTSCNFTMSTDNSTTPATRTITWSGGGESWPLTP